jgi:hypothetical protein
VTPARWGRAAQGAQLELEVMIVLDVASTVAPGLANQLHDWLTMVGIAIVISIPTVVATVRHRMWRRRVLSACR